MATSLTKDPLSGANIGLSNKNATTDVKEESANKVKPIYTTTGGSGFASVADDPNKLAQAAYENKAPLYRSSSGTLSTSPRASATLDKKTGKITVHAPKFLENSELFKDYYENQLQPTIQTLSANYKANPKYQYPVLDENGKETGETESVEDILNRLNDTDINNQQSLTYVANAAGQVLQQKNNIQDWFKKRFGRDLQLSDYDIINNSYTALGADVNDDTLQSIPEIPEANFFRMIESYDPEKKVAKLGNIMQDAWNREKISDDDILHLYDSLKNHLEEGDLSNTDEVMRRISLLQFMEGRDPGVDFWRGTGETLRAGWDWFWGSLADKFHTLAVGAHEVTDGNMAILAAGMPSPVPDFLDPEGATNYANMSGPTKEQVKNFNTEWNNRIKNDMEDLRLLNDWSANVAGIANFVGDLAISAIVSKGIGKIISAGAGAVSGALASAAGDSAKIASALEASSLGAESLTNGAKLLTSMLGSSKTAQLYSLLANMSAKTAKLATSTFASEALNTVLSSFTDAIIFDSQQLREILTNDNLTTEGKDLILAELGQNVAFAGLGEMGKRAVKYAGKTLPGRVLSQNWAKFNAKVQVKFGDFIEKMRVEVHGFKDWDDMLKNSKVSDKMKTLAFNHVLRDLKRTVAKQDWAHVLGHNGEDILKQVQELENRTARNLEKGEGILNDILRNNQGTINWLVRSGAFPDLSAAYKNLSNVTDNILKLEKADAGNLRKGRIFTEKTGNYIGAVIDRDLTIAQMEHYRSIGQLDEATEKAYQKTIDYDNNLIAQFKLSASYELRAAANEYINRYRTFYYNLEDAVSSKLVNVKDPEVLRTMRESGKYGEDGRLYGKVQRTVEAPKFKPTEDAARKRTTLEYQERTPGATGDFVDPTLVVQADLQQIAGVYNAQQLTKIYLNNGMANVVVDSTVAKFVETTKELHAKAKQEIFDTVAKALESEELSMSVRDALIGRQFDIAGAEATRQTLFAGSEYLTDNQVEDIFNRFTDESGVSRTLFDEDGALKADAPDGIKATLEDSSQRLNDKTMFELDDNGVPKLNRKNYEVARQLDTSLDNRLMRTYINNTPSIITDKGVVKEIRKAIKGRKDFNRATIYRSNLENYRKYAEALGKSAENIQSSLELIVENIIDNIKTKQGAALASAKGLAGMYGKGNDEAILRYMILDELSGNFGKYEGTIIEAINKNIKEIGDLTKLSAQEVEDLISDLKTGLEDIIDAEFDNSINIIRGINPDLLDQKEIYNRVKALDEQISGYKSDYNYVASNDLNGQIQYVQVDPSLGYYLKSANIQRGELGLLAQLNYIQSKIYRMGQTGISITSMMSQMFRDTGNAIIMGGVNRTIMGNEQLLRETFGDNVATYIKQYDDAAQSMLREIAEETGQDLGKVMADYELGLLKRNGERLGYGRAFSPAATETAEYSRTRGMGEMKYRNGKPVDRKVYQKVGDTVDSITEKIGKVNEMREQYLRNLVYANAYQDGIKRGLTVENARYHAQYLMDNATTNFSRPLVHLESFRRAVPYLGAAINGTKSFWRLWAMDPVGVTGRIIGGVIIPTMALTAMSLNSEENRKAWKNLTEYQKDENMCFALNGQIFTIPIPQEFAPYIAPWRQMVEKMYDANDKAFTDLLLNDLVGAVPLDLSGFVDIDSYKLFDQDFGDHMSKGFVRLWSQIAPPIAKSAMMYITGIDPYTLKEIDSSYVQFDEETGQKIIIDKTSGDFAKQFSKWCTSMGINMSSAMAQKMLNSIFGNGNQRIVDGLTGLLQAVVPGGEDPENWYDVIAGPAQKLVEAAVSPLYVNAYDQSQAAWRQAINYLYDKKNKILHDETVGYQRAMTNLRNASTVQEQEAARTALRNITDPFYKEVLEVATNLKNQYGATFTGNKFASVLSLLNLAEGTVSANPASDLINTNEYNQGRVQAIQTMQRFGFPSSDEARSIFGEYKVNKKTGEIYTRFTNPVAILDMKNVIKYASDIHTANLETIINDNQIWTQMKEYKNRRSEALNKKDYKTANNISKEWNKRMVNTLDPYIQQYTPQAVVNDYDVMEKLADMFLLPYDYAVDKRGRNISAPDLNKTEGFIRNYIKEIYGLRD